MQKGTRLKFSAEGMAGKPAIKEEGVRLIPATVRRSGEVVYGVGTTLVFPGVWLNRLHGLREVEPFEKVEGGTLYLAVSRSHLEEFHRELGEFLAKQQRPAEPPAT